LLIDPNIVFLLLAIGLQALLIELTHPGAWLPAFFGVVCLPAGLRAWASLPVNLVRPDLHGHPPCAVHPWISMAPTHGALTIAGSYRSSSRAPVLFNSRHAALSECFRPLVLFVGVFIGLIFAVILGLPCGRKAVRLSRSARLEGQTGYAVSEIDPSGQAQLAGELWSATWPTLPAPSIAATGSRWFGWKGLRLKVRKKLGRGCNPAIPNRKNTELPGTCNGAGQLLYPFFPASQVIRFSSSPLSGFKFAPGALWYRCG